MNESLKNLILQMSPEALKDVLDIIRQRPEIVAIDIVTESELIDMEKRYSEKFDFINGIKQEPENEPA